MRECCDWHGVCLNHKELLEINDKEKEVYLSYCPEYISISQSYEGVVTKLEKYKVDKYFEKYKNKIEMANSKK